MPPRERIDFTHRELEALSNLLSMTADHDEWLDETFPDLERVERAALKRASEKVARAHRKATTGSPADPDVLCNTCDNRGRSTHRLDGQVVGCPGCGHLAGQHPNGLQARHG